MTEPAIERCFAVLGLPATASEEEVKEARNFVTKAFHPDKYQAGSKDQKKAHERQIEINEAYERLSAWFQSKKSAQTAGSVFGGKQAGRRSRGGDEKIGSNKKVRIVAVVKIGMLIAVSFAWIFLINASFSGHAPNEATSASLPRFGRVVSGPPSDWLFLLLILCTLGLSWILFAPEASLLINRWTKDKVGQESIGNQGVGGN